MHDGQNLFDASSVGAEWTMDEAAQALIKSGDIAPLIIVGIGNTADRIDEYTPTRQIWHRTLQRREPPVAKGPLARFTGTFVTEKNDSIYFTARADTLLIKLPASDNWADASGEIRLGILSANGGNNPPISW